MQLCHPLVKTFMLTKTIPFQSGKCWHKGWIEADIIQYTRTLCNTLDDKVWQQVNFFLLKFTLSFLAAFEVWCKLSKQSYAIGALRCNFDNHNLVQYAPYKAHSGECLCHCHQIQIERFRCINDKYWDFVPTCLTSLFYTQNKNRQMQQTLGEYAKNKHILVFFFLPLRWPLPKFNMLHFCFAPFPNQPNRQRYMFGTHVASV